MARRKREPMSEGKKNIIGMLLEEYDIESAKDIEDAFGKAEHLIADGGYGHTSSIYLNVETEKEKLEEEIFLGFRRACGINISEINSKFNIDFEKKYQNTLKKYLETGHLKRTNDGYALTNEGFLISTVILAEFI